MKERPILFSGPLVRAIIEGRKTQTRRVMKPQPSALDNRMGWVHAKAQSWIELSDVRHMGPYGKPGDQLWVRETFCAVDDSEHDGEKWIDYRATPKYGHDAPGGWDKKEHAGDPDALKWKPSIFMPRWASRINLKVTGIRVERAKDISEDDALAEGVGGAAPENTFASARDEFAALWETINAKRGFGWDSNPWVWVIDFERIDS